MAELQNQEALDKALDHFSDAKQAHDEFVEAVEKRYKVYRGVLDIASDAAQWTSKSHPPYIMHIVETTLASLIEDKLKFRVRPKASLANMVDPGAGKRATDGARAHQILFDWQTRLDGFTKKQRPFILQNAIAGLTVAKTSWSSRKERRRQLVAAEEPLLDENEQPILNQMTGQPVTVPSFKEKVAVTTVYDGPTTEVRDVRDFLWTPNATSLQTSPYVIDRVWKTPEEIEKDFRDGGPFGPKRGGWTLEQVKDKLTESKDSSKEELETRERSLFNVDRTKGLVEVWEVWDNQKKCLTTVANRCALLAYREGFPFYHDDYPFVVCSTQPDLFRIPGISQVEKIAHLQTLLWDITNQSLDNLRLVNNAIFFFRPDMEDIDSYEFYPGARWLVEDPAQVNNWAPNPLPAEVSIGREALIKGDMQTLAGGFPFSSGTDSQFVDQKTATGASIVSSLAQRSMDLAKKQLYAAWEEIGEQRMILNQQFIREPMVAPVLGLDSEEQLEVIWPELLQGDFEFQLEPIPDALMKQEEQAAAQGLLQAIAPLIPMTAAGAGTPLNLDAFVEDLLRAHGKEDFDRYFSKTPPAMPQPGAGGGGVAPGAPQADPLGVTGQGSIDPSVSPSSSTSLSPMRNLQRAQALDRS